MVMSFQRQRTLVLPLWLLTCLCLLLCMPVLAETEEKGAESVVSFPGINEVIPQSTSIAAQINKAEAIINQSKELDDIYLKLAEVAENLKILEEQFNDWTEMIDWPLNRLLTAEARYDQISQNEEKLFATLSQQLSAIESLHKQWTAEKEHWKAWQTSLQKSGVKTPNEVFNKTLREIESLLQKISAESATLIKKEQEFSPTQEILTSRIGLIRTTLNQLRKEIFRRNAHSLFSAAFYSQLTPELFNNYRKNLTSNFKLTDGFWMQNGWIVVLQLICVVVLSIILSQRRRRPKPISDDWRFLFSYPLSGATFITLAATSTFYEHTPPFWGWLILTILTISGTVLIAAMAENSRRRRVIIALAFVYLLSEVLKVSGLPTPAYQFYEVLLCALAAPICLLIARRRQRQEPDRFGVYLASLYTISLLAMIGLVTALLGFSTLSIHLIDAVLGTIIVLFMVKMTIHLADGGITEFLRLQGVRNRQFVLTLGLSTADKLKTLARIIILVEAFLYVLVVWGFYADADEASSALLNLEYTIGDLSISVYMVAMVAVVLYLTSLTSWVLQALTDAHFMTPRKMDLGVKTALKRLLHYALFTGGFFVAVGMAGLDLQKFTIIAGALSVGIGFGLQNIVNNFVSGLILLFERPVKVGDTINIDEQWGTITRIGMRSTVFETLDRSEVIVPNSDLISQKVTNWTFTTNVSRIVLTVGVAYGSPLDKVLDILVRVAKEHPDILKDPESSAIFTGFGESSIDFELRVWVSDISKRPKIKSDMGQAVDRYFREEGITIPFPQRDLHLRSIEEDLRSSFVESKPTGD